METSHDDAEHSRRESDNSIEFAALSPEKYQPRLAEALAAEAHLRCTPVLLPRIWVSRIFCDTVHHRLVLDPPSLHPIFLRMHSLGRNRLSAPSTTNRHTN